MCAALNASITDYEPRKLFAIGLTVEQISQRISSWHELGVESTKTILSENRVSPFERLGISVSTVSQSAMNQLWLLCRSAQSPIKSRRQCEESQQDLCH
jgi:hypothetical protein